MNNHHYFCLEDKLYINAYHPSNQPFNSTKYELNYVNQIRMAVNDWIKNDRRVERSAI